jgi:drug/metabolite transporter (DMT)-like permease
MLLLRGGHVLTLSMGSYFWAALAGICIGSAEIGYLYLFGRIDLSNPMAAGIAIPTIVSGTIVIAMLFSYFVLKETIAWNQMLGSLLIVFSIILLFVTALKNPNDIEASIKYLDDVMFVGILGEIPVSSVDDYGDNF